MIRTLRAFFLSRALREKLLLLAFVGIGAAWWASAYAGRFGSFWRAQRTTTIQLREQTEWIKNQTAIEKNAQKTTGRLDPARTLNGNQLVATISQLANEAGLSQYSAGTPATRPTGQFTVHQVEFTIRNVEWGALTKFYEALQQKSPYIAVERFILSSGLNNQAQLNLTLKVMSVEIVR